jgi:uncharacterized protein
MTITSHKNLLVLAKRPSLGKAKTRLASSLGNENALEIYKLLLNRTVQLADNVSFKSFFCLSGEESFILPSQFTVFEQCKGDLGLRMEKAFEHVFKNTNGPVVMIGSDCHDLKEEHLIAAFEALENHDYVFGPSEDGGYYLIGMNAFRTETLREMPWSTEILLKVTLSKVKSQSLSFKLLDVLNDIDTFADLKSSSLWDNLPIHLKTNN